MCRQSDSLCVRDSQGRPSELSSKLGDTPLARLDLFESLPSRRVGCMYKSIYNKLYLQQTTTQAGSSSRGGCRALQLYIALQRSRALYSSTALQRSTLYILYTLPQSCRGCGTLSSVLLPIPRLGLSVFFLLFFGVWAELACWQTCVASSLLSARVGELRMGGRKSRFVETRECIHLAPASRAC